MPVRRCSRPSLRRHSGTFREVEAWATAEGDPRLGYPLRQNLSFPWCQRVLDRFELRPTLHHRAHYRVWGGRGYGMNIWSEKKRKLDCMHNNPVARALLAQPGDWPWSRRGGGILLPERQFRFGDGSDAVNRGRRRVAPRYQGRRHRRNL